MIRTCNSLKNFKKLLKIDIMILQIYRSLNINKNIHYHDINIGLIGNFIIVKLILDLIHENKTYELIIFKITNYKCKW